MNILIDSLNFNPFLGSNSECGYGFVKEISKKHSIHLIASDNIFHRSENKAENLDIENITLHLIKPGIFRKFGIQTDYLTKVFSKAKEIIKKNNINLVHTIEPNQYQMPRPLAFLNKPFILGPIHGGDAYPSKHFLNDLNNRFSKHKNSKN